MKQKLHPIFALFFLLMLFSCKSTTDKITDFVNSYNNAAATMSSTVVTHTSAKAVSDKEIRVIFKTSEDQSESNKSMYQKIMPSMITEIVTADNTVSGLTDDGVKIDFVLLASDGSELSTLIVDKKKMAELQSLKNSDPATSASSNVSPQLQQILTALNRSLPITDKTAGTTITKITADEKHALVYTIQVDDSLAKNLKGKGAANLLRENLLRDSNVKRMLPGLRPYGITNITYKYCDSKGEAINETSISASELR